MIITNAAFVIYLCYMVIGGTNSENNTIGTDSEYNDSENLIISPDEERQLLYSNPNNHHHKIQKTLSNQLNSDLAQNLTELPINSEISSKEYESTTSYITVYDDLDEVFENSTTSFSTTTSDYISIVEYDVDPQVGLENEQLFGLTTTNDDNTTAAYDEDDFTTEFYESSTDISSTTQTDSSDHSTTISDDSITTVRSSDMVTELLVEIVSTTSKPPPPIPTLTELRNPNLLFNLNDWVDKVFIFITHKINERGMIPIALPGLTKNFTKTVLFWTYDIQYNLTSGYLVNVSSIQRNGEAFSSFGGFQLNVTFPLLIKDVQSTYNYSLQMNAEDGPMNGTVNVTISTLKLNLTVGVLLFNIQPGFEFKLGEIGPIHTNFSDENLNVMMAFAMDDMNGMVSSGIEEMMQKLLTFVILIWRSITR